MGASGGALRTRGTVTVRRSVDSFSVCVCVCVCVFVCVVAVTCVAGQLMIAD